jgi:hypothetical protein
VCSEVWSVREGIHSREEIRVEHCGFDGMISVC